MSPTWARAGLSAVGVRVVRVGRALISARPPSLVDDRDALRLTLVTTITLVAIVVVLVQGGGDPSPIQVITLLAGIVFTVLCATPSASVFLDRWGGVLAMLACASAIAITGGAASPMHAVYIPLVVYAAIFYGAARFRVSLWVIVALAALPLAYDRPAEALRLGPLLTASIPVVGVLAAALHTFSHRVRAVAETDLLTGLWNHGMFWHGAALEHARTERSRDPYTVLLVDIDHFKRVNDTLGHRAGDRVLESVAKVVARQLRDGDIVARYGGEELAVLLPEASRATAQDVAERIRTAVSQADTRPRVTVSVGVAAWRPGLSLDQVVHAADRALYGAKEAGRDRVWSG